MLKSRLFLKMFTAIVAVLSALAAAIYFVAVPMVERNAFQVELDASRTILDNVFEMASRMSGSLEERRAVTVASFKTQLRDVVAVAAAYVEYVFARRDRGELTDSEARQLVFEGLRTFKYGHDGYIWVIDHDAKIVSHPDASFHGVDSSKIEADGASTPSTIVNIARSQGEGFHTYAWTKLGSTHPSQKMSYFKDLPRYGVVVGSGAYLDEIDREVERRKAEAIEDLRSALRGIRIARTGYAYIFDADNNMLIHPNPNIEGSEFSGRPNPATGRPIADELKFVADSGKPHHYLWDRPSDPGRYVYEKLSWVRHFKEFNWYIASSVYVDELRAGSLALGRRILIISAICIGLTGLVVAFAARRFVEPLQQLALTASRVSSGDLDAQTGIVRRDEIGVLAAAFDGMIVRLRENMDSLGKRVSERTSELEDANRRLQHAVAAQQRSKTVLAEVEARQRLVLDAIPASIAYLDAEERLRFANRGWRELTGVQPSQEIEGELLAHIIGPKAYTVIAPNIERTHRGETATFDYVFIGRHGRQIVTRNVLLPQIGATGSTVGMFVLSRDVTDEKETERKLTEAQRLNAVGQLAGGLAHDFNNLLSIIIGNLSAARDKYGDVEGLESYLEPAQRASRRGADITSRLLAFSRQHPLRAEPLDVATLMQEVVVLLRRTLPTLIRIECSAEPRAAWALTDQSQLQHALVNMALNARDAMPEGGTLTFKVAHRVVEPGTTFDEEVAPGAYAEIVVSDTGEGFTPAALARAYEPFFTTKTLGSGLGLSMVYGFVKQSKGYIRIESGSGGTTITLLLPEASALGDSLDAGGSQPPTADAAWHGLLAVVAEDDDDVRRVMREQLNSLGFSILEAGTGEEALRLAGQVENVRLVVSDVVMPGVSGIDVARRIRAARPDMAIVLMTGFSLELRPEEVLGDVPVLMKPWRRRDLRAAISQLIPPQPAAEDLGVS